MPFCSNCGSWVDKGVEKCPKCGLNPNIKAEVKEKKKESKKIPYDLPTSKFHSSIFMGSLTKAFTYLRENPSIYLIGLLFYALQMPYQIITFFPPAGPLKYLLQFSFMVVLFLIGVFFVGGILGIAKKLFHKKKYSFNTFLEEGKRNYVRLLIGSILYLIITAVSVVLLILIILFCAIASMPIVGILCSLIFIVLIQMFFAFYGIILVADELSVIDSFKKSYFFARMNFSNVFAYYITDFVVSILIMLPVIAIYLVWFLRDMSKIGGETIYSLQMTMPLEYRLLSFILMLFLGALSYLISFLYNTQFYLSLTRKK